MSKIIYAAPLVLSQSAFNTITRAVIESSPCETTGYLYLSRADIAWYVEEAQPIITAKRKKSSVEYGKPKAIKRLHRLQKILTPNCLVGGFHSHPNTFYEAELSRGDVDFSRAEMKRSQQENWLELIVKTESMKTKNEYKPSIQVHQKEKNVFVRIQDKENHTYTLEFAAYLIIPKKKYQHDIKKKNKLKHFSKKCSLEHLPIRLASKQL